MEVRRAWRPSRPRASVSNLPVEMLNLIATFVKSDLANIPQNQKNLTLDTRLCLLGRKKGKGFTRTLQPRKEILCVGNFFGKVYPGKRTRIQPVDGVFSRGRDGSAYPSDPAPIDSPASRGN